MLELKNLTKIYGGSGVKAVDGLNLTVRAGEIFGFLGPNGSGKTTTIKMITGILRPTEGEIYFEGAAQSQNKLEMKRNIGYVPDDRAMYDRLTGTQYLNFIGDVYKVPTALRRERAEKFLAEFDLAHAADEPIKSYSSGMKQKIAVTAALLSKPKLWILDEPLAALDPKSAYIVKELMRAHAKDGNTVFFSSHVIDVVEKMCDRVGIIADGKLLDTGTVAEIKDRLKKDSLEEAFLEMTARTARSGERV